MTICQPRPSLGYAAKGGVAGDLSVARYRCAAGCWRSGFLLIPPLRPSSPRLSEIFNDTVGLSTDRFPDTLEASPLRL
jgi:hypothetical protein